MPRLFVAVELPTSATAQLVRIQPPPSDGVRRTEPRQMHLTLHFIGEADAERIGAALHEVTVPAFELLLEGVGQFPSAGGAVTLWAGVRESPELLGLHATVTAALGREGFRPEARRYTPHISLARCEPGVSEDVVNEFLTRYADFTLPAVPVTRLGLYSSTFVDGVPVYRCEWSFPLTGIVRG